MILCELLTSWIIGDGTTENGNRPEIADAYTIRKTEDVTGQPSENLAPNPNLFVLKCWVDDAVFAQIEADRPDDILWSEVLVDG